LEVEVAARVVGDMQDRPGPACRLGGSGRGQRSGGGDNESNQNPVLRQQHGFLLGLRSTHMISMSVHSLTPEKTQNRENPDGIWRKEERRDVDGLRRFPKQA